MLVRFLVLAIICQLAARAGLVETSIEWKPACDGSTIEVISDNGKIHSVRAIAAHSLVFREWTIYYVDGHAVTAEFRESARGKILEGDRAGEESGLNPIKKIQTFGMVDGKFGVSNKELSDDLAEVLAKAKSTAKARVVNGYNAPGFHPR